MVHANFQSHTVTHAVKYFTHLLYSADKRVKLIANFGTVFIKRLQKSFFHTLLTFFLHLSERLLQTCAFAVSANLRGINHLIIIYDTKSARNFGRKLFWWASPSCRIRERRHEGCTASVWWAAVAVFLTFQPSWDREVAEHETRAPTNQPEHNKRKLKPQSTKSVFTGPIKLWWLVSRSGNAVLHFAKR